MLRLLLIFILFSALSVSGHAQTTAPGDPPADTAAASANVDAFIRIIENDETRLELINRLRKRGGEIATASEEASPSLATQVAEYTRQAAEQLSAGTMLAASAATELVGVFSGAGGRLANLQTALLEIAVVAAVLLVVFFALRALIRWIKTSLARRAMGGSFVVVLVSVVIALVLEWASVGIAWAAGYFTALQAATGELGRMSLSQTLLLNAFLVVETIKAVLRATLQPRDPALRFLPLSDTSAAYWHFWLARLTSLVGYTFLFIAPLLANNVSSALAQALRVLVLFVALVTVVIIVLQNKSAVRTALSARAAEEGGNPLSRSLPLIARYWHVVAIAYAVAIFLVWMVNPTNALPFMLAATAQTVLAIVVASVVIYGVNRFVHGGLHLPQDIRTRLPLLEHRLNAFVPRVMQVVRFLVILCAVLFITQAWALLDFSGWLVSEAGTRVTGAVASAGIIVLIGFAIYIAMSSWVEYRLNPQIGHVATAREKTLLSLFRNAFTIALAVLITMLALAQIGVNIAPLLAGAGVLGLAIGFGAQKFVQDIITGAFIQFENIMNEGDVVQAGGQSGVVEHLTIRSVSIRSADGTLHVIPFSSVDAVSNMMRGFSYHVADIGVAYREDIGEVKEAMGEAFDLLMQTEHKDSIVDALEMQGVTALGDSAVNVRARIKTLPGKHWGAGRAYNEIIKTVFDRRGIELPYPHMTIYMGEDKQGNAPPLHIEGLTPSAPATPPVQANPGTSEPKPA